MPTGTIAAGVLAFVFLATGLGKAFDLVGFAAVLGEYRLFPPALLLPVASLVVVVELAIVAGLVTRRGRRAAALAAAAVAVANAVLLTITLARGIELANCGCFGVFLARPLTWLTPVEDLILLALALFVARRA